MSGAILWCEISDTCEKARYEALSKEVSELGAPNQVEFVETTEAEFNHVLSEAKKKFQQIRIGGSFRELVFKNSESLPSVLLPLRSADAVVGEAGEGGVVHWWPRNFLAVGFARSLTSKMGGVDLTGGVFLLGATSETRALVSALTKIGFKKFSLADPDLEKVEKLIEELRRSYFGVQFQLVPRHLVTQMPTTNSVAVNTLSITDDATLAELSFFNFLKPGGVWLDISPKAPREVLAAEAQSIGASILSSVDALVEADRAWVEACFKLNIDGERYLKALS